MNNFSIIDIMYPVSCMIIGAVMLAATYQDEIKEYRYMKSLISSQSSSIDDLKNRLVKNKKSNDKYCVNDQCFPFQSECDWVAFSSVPKQTCEYKILQPKQIEKLTKLLDA